MAAKISNVGCPPQSWIKLSAPSASPPPPLPSPSQPHRLPTGGFSVLSESTGPSCGFYGCAPTLPFVTRRLFNLREKWPQSARRPVVGSYGEERGCFTINIRPISCTQSATAGDGRIFISVGAWNLWLTNGRSSLEFVFAWK